MLEILKVYNVCVQDINAATQEPTGALNQATVSPARFEVRTILLHSNLVWNSVIFLVCLSYEPITQMNNYKISQNSISRF